MSNSNGQGQGNWPQPSPAQASQQTGYAQPPPGMPQMQPPQMQPPQMQPPQMQPPQYQTQMQPPQYQSMPPPGHQQAPMPMAGTPSQSRTETLVDPSLPFRIDRTEKSWEWGDGKAGPPLPNAVRVNLIIDKVEVFIAGDGDSRLRLYLRVLDGQFQGKEFRQAFGSRKGLNYTRALLRSVGVPEDVDPVPSVFTGRAFSAETLHRPPNDSGTVYMDLIEFRPYQPAQAIQQQQFQPPQQPQQPQQPQLWQGGGGYTRQ